MSLKPLKKKKYILFTVTFICFLLFLNPGKSHKELKADAIGVVNVNGYLNVRKGPGIAYAKLQAGGTSVVLSNGQKVIVIEKNGDWYHIKFTQNSRNLNGYVNKKYLKFKTGKTYTSIVGYVSSETNVRKNLNAKKEYLTKDGKKITLPSKRKVRIYIEKKSGVKRWYYALFVYEGTSYKGYIATENVNVSYGTGLPGISKSSRNLNMLKTPGKAIVITNSSGREIVVKNGDQFVILGEKTVVSKRYFKVKFISAKTTYTGYILADNVYFQIIKGKSASATKKPAVTKKPTVTAKPSKKPDATAAPKVTEKPTAAPETNAEFKKNLKKAGFPDDYITELVKLHEKYPCWEFKPYKTGLKWSTVINNESKVGLNLLSINKSYAWKSTEAKAYDWTKDRYIPYDGSTWVTASKKAVKYYMDPRNFLDERGIFQFESLEYQRGSQTQSGVENILKNTPMYNKKYTYKSSGKNVSVKYSKTFMTAAKKSKVSPYHLASRVKQEVVINANKMSSSVSGTVSGYKGIYNFYNIGANNSVVAGGAVANGLKWAKTGKTYLRPWNNRYKSLVGGAQYIGKNYINMGQNTLYLEKFNVTAKNRYNHQYMGNIEAPNNEATKTVAAYGVIDKNMSMVFSIPVYDNMPEEACDVPSGGKNPNNYLSTLYIKDHAFDSKFVLGDNGTKTYTLTVNNSVSSVKICASKLSKHSTMTGTGIKSLEVGTNTFYVKVKSESGNTRKYKIVVTRK